MKHFLPVLLAALLLTAPAYAQSTTTYRGGTHSSTLQSADSFPFQRNNTGPYFYINKSEIASGLGLATVATSGLYSDLSGKPTIPAAQINSDWNAVSGLAQILNKPSLGTSSSHAATDFFQVSNNLSEGTASTMRTNLGLGTLATQSGTFSGTSSGTNSGDQSMFSSLAVSGQTTVTPASTTDTLHFAAGSNVTITTDNSTKTLTINSTASGGSSTLAALTDVSLTSPADKNLLKYVTADSKWENGTLAWGEVTGKPSFATVATSGAYSDLSGTPSLATVATSGAYGDLSGTPSFNTLSPMTTLGDVIYGGASGAGTRLAGNTSATKKFLTQTGTGTVSAAPAWATIAGADLPNPGASSLGGVESLASASHKWLNTISTSGVPAATQPACGDLSDSGTACQHASTDFEVPLTFSTGLTRSTNTVTVNTSQNIATLSNLTSNGFVKTGSGTGTLSVDTTAYVPQTTTVNSHALSGNVTVSASDLSTGTLAMAQQPANLVVSSFGITIDGGGSVPATGSKGFITIPYNETITNWYVATDQSCSAVVDIKNAGTSVIGSGNKPTVSSAQTANAAVSSWTSAAVTAGEIFEFSLSSVSTCTRINLVVSGNRT